jgi:molecular chaperone DnaK (HSP70)
MINEAEENAEIDRKRKQGAEARNQLESYLYQVITSASNQSLNISPEEKREITDLVEETYRWLEQVGNTASEDDCNAWKAKVEAIASPILTKAYESEPNQPEPSVQEV